mmetsp:Transcript_60219/g.68597  ORF Transcript_60219/g.68597 Transcript_60219/m.68597 type:complete len:205 (+) Transcript_60219:1153-1767(+)
MCLKCEYVFHHIAEEYTEDPVVSQSHIEDNSITSSKVIKSLFTDGGVDDHLIEQRQQHSRGEFCQVSHTARSDESAELEDVHFPLVNGSREIEFFHISSLAIKNTNQATRLTHSIGLLFALPNFSSNGSNFIRAQQIVVTVQCNNLEYGTIQSVLVGHIILEFVLILDTILQMGSKLNEVLSHNGTLIRVFWGHICQFVEETGH